MSLKTIAPACFFVTLTALGLLFNSTYSSAFESGQQEPQAANSEQNDNSTSAEKDTDSKAKTTNTDQENIPENPKQHQAIIKAPVDAFEQQQQDIKHYLAQEKISTLLVGPDNYLTAINEHTTAINKGVMVLIPDWQQSIATPNALNQLRKNMPQQGWTTITLHPPHRPSSYPSQALTAEERSTENQQTLSNYGKKFANIMLAVMEKAKSYPGVIIVIVEGNHSAVLLDIYQQSLVDAPSALIMLSSYMPTIPASNKIAQQLAITDYPILDLYLKRDHHLVLANAKMRKYHAKRELKVYYRQKELSNLVTGYYPKYTLTKEIISWLSTIGW